VWHAERVARENLALDNHAESLQHSPLCLLSHS
jgi:hypothetical protein